MGCIRGYSKKLWCTLQWSEVGNKIKTSFGEIDWNVNKSWHQKFAGCLISRLFQTFMMLMIGDGESWSYLSTCYCEISRFPTSRAFFRRSLVKYVCPTELLWNWEQWYCLNQNIVRYFQKIKGNILFINIFKYQIIVIMKTSN